MTSGWTDVDATHLTRALELAGQGRAGARPNPVVGAVIARGDEVLAEGFHARYGAAHAERVALDQLPGEVPADATMYVTLEPCAHHGRQPPCCELVTARGVRRVVIAGADPTDKTAGIGPEHLLDHGVEVVWAPAPFPAEAAQQNAGFLTRALHHRPYVTCKWAMTRNGRVATGDPAHRWISSEASRAQVHELRAASGAIVVGIGTVLADDPALTVRGPAAERIVTPPLRVVVDRDLRIPLESQLVRTAREVPTLVVAAAGTRDAATAVALRAAGVEVLSFERATLEASLLTALADREVNDVLLEAGPTVASAWHELGLVDRLVAYVAPFEADATQPGFETGHPLREALARAAAAAATCGPDTVYDVVLHPVSAVEQRRR